MSLAALTDSSQLAVLVSSGLSVAATVTFGTRNFSAELPESSSLSAAWSVFGILDDAGRSVSDTTRNVASTVLSASSMSSRALQVYVAPYSLSPGRSYQFVVRVWFTLDGQSRAETSAVVNVTTASTPYGGSVIVSPGQAGTAGLTR